MSFFSWFLLLLVIEETASCFLHGSTTRLLLAVLEIERVGVLVFCDLVWEESFKIKILCMILIMAWSSERTRSIVAKNIWNSEIVICEFGCLEFFRNCELWVFRIPYKLWALGAWKSSKIVSSVGGWNSSEIVSFGVFGNFHKLWAWGCLEIFTNCKLGCLQFVKINFEDSISRKRIF